jgi:hypothetical protein
MDDEPAAKRRCLNYVEKTLPINPDRVSQQSLSQKGFAQVQDISVPSEDTLAVETENLFDTSAHFDCEATAEQTFEHRLPHVQQPDHVLRNKSLSGLDQVTYAQDEAAHNSVRSIAGAVREHDTSGVHHANDGHRDRKGDSEVCFGMVCQMSPVQPTGPSKIY